ncbi:MAG: HEAT repeat domain-containing protein, partial [Thermoplasmata archaeon]
VAGRYRDREAVPRLLELLAAPETWEKPAVLVALGRIGDPSVLPSVLAAAESPQHWLRVCAVHALGDLGGPEARSVALRSLRDPTWPVRGAAAIALGNVGGPDDLGVLLERLRDEHAWPRRGATYALGRLGLAAAAPRIREELTDPAAEVRLAAVWALGRLGDDGAREELVRLLRSVPPQSDPSPVPEGEESDLRSDAESRLFDAVVQALGRLPHGVDDPFVQSALVSARARLSDEELDRLARLPLPEAGPDREPLTLRTLFEAAIAASFDDEDSG